jgi:hypothetical protein
VPDVMSPSDRNLRRSVVVLTLEERTHLLWPRLDGAALRRCHHDPDRIVELVSSRTSLPRKAVVDRLVVRSVSDDDTALWFG